MLRSRAILYVTVSRCCCSAVIVWQSSPKPLLFCGCWLGCLVRPELAWVLHMSLFTCALSSCDIVIAVFICCVGCYARTIENSSSTIEPYGDQQLPDASLQIETEFFCLWLWSIPSLKSSLCFYFLISRYLCVCFRRRKHRAIVSCRVPVFFQTGWCRGRKPSIVDRYDHLHLLQELESWTIFWLLSFCWSALYQWLRTWRVEDILFRSSLYCSGWHV